MNKRFYKLCRRLFLLLVIAFVFSQTSEVYANTFTVNSTDDMVDASPGDGKCETGRDAPGVTPAAKECTLRAAMQESNALAGEDEIILPSGTYVLSQSVPCTYRRKDDPNFQTDTMTPLCVSSQMTIKGAGASATIIDGGNRDRVFFVSASADAEIRGATIQNGVGSGGIYVFGGGGINNQGKLTLSETAFNTNRTEASGGGGVINVGTLTVNKSAFVGNTAIPNLGSAGGIYNYGGELTITDSLFNGNTAGSGGGGIAIYGGNVTITGSTFSDNIAGHGGGINVYHGTLTLTNSTISGNSTWMGGGLSSGEFATVNLNNVTITRNNSQRAGGGVSKGGIFRFRNTIIAGNTATDYPAWSDFTCNSGTLTSQGYNLIQKPADICRIEGDTTGNITGKDARLGALLNYGGLTPTHALFPDSPAIDAGNPNAPGSGGTACAAADQRGVLRPVGSRCDIGAFEREGRFSVTGSLPNRGGNTASVIAVISGGGFKDGATVRLRRAGEADIAGAPVAVEAGGSSLTTSFDLNGKALGAWDVVVTNPDGTSTTLSNGFTIEETKAPQLWSQIVGRSAIRVGLPAKYNIIYGNRGNVDAYAVPLTISVPANLQLNVYFQYAPPPAQAGQVPTNWSEVPVDVLPGRATGANTTAIFLLPVIPAGSTGALRISLLLPPDAQHGDVVTFAAYLGDPYFKPNLDSKILDGMVAGAQSYSQKSLGVTIPPALIPELKRYATTQLQLLVESGRQSLVTSLLTQPQVYSVAQLNFDLARFGAARATGTNPSSIASFKAANNEASASSVPSISPLAGKAGGASNPCAGQVLGEGQSCGDNPNPIPAPDKPPPGPPGIPKGDCNQIPNHKLSDDGTRCVPIDKKGCAIFQNPLLTDPDCLIIPVRRSVDPNDKAGAPGVLEKRFLPGATPFAYTIFFENLPTATAAAQVVIITDQLDVANLDLSTFSFGSISFDKYTVTPPPGKSEFVAALDLRPANNLIVKIDARLDKSTGLLTWRFTSLDPDTQEPTDDPDAGFLAPNRTSPEGEGSVTFFVRPKPGLATGTEIRNKARIVFDVNAPIDTPEWLNTVDDSRPTSGVLSLPAEQQATNFEVKWSGTDTGAGIESYTVYVSENGGAFTVWQKDTTDTSATFAGQTGKTYSFYSVARDAAGNREDPPAAPDATTTVPAPATLQFTLGSVNISEGSGKVTVTVRRTGALSQAASVAYETLSGTASDRSDFNTTIGTLSFAAGEEEKSIEVLLTDDTLQEAAENFTVRLANASGAAVGAVNAITVTITDNDDAVSSRTNMIDTAEGFVRQQYVDFLNRQPDASGFQFWTNEITTCGADRQCIETKRINVSAAFFLSIEFQETGYLVYRLHEAAFDTGERLRLREFLPDTQRIGRGVVVNQPGWEQQLEANKQAFAEEFVSRQAFLDRYPATMSAAQYVDALNANAGGSLSQGERDELVSRLGAGQVTRAQALRAVAEDQDFQRREFNRAFVLMQYFGYLRRNPDDAPDGDFSGFNFWLAKLDRFNGNFVQAEMVKAFIVSAEYRRRFGPE